MDIRGSVTWVLWVQAVGQLDSCVVVILPSHYLSYQLAASNSQTHVVNLAVRQAVCGQGWRSAGREAGIRMEPSSLAERGTALPQAGVPQRRGHQTRAAKPSCGQQPPQLSHSHPHHQHEYHQPYRKTPNCLSEVQPLMSSPILREAWGGA